jgi:hypothetical protein
MAILFYSSFKKQERKCSVIFCFFKLVLVETVKKIARAIKVLKTIIISQIYLVNFIFKHLQRLQPDN